MSSYRYRGHLAARLALTATLASLGGGAAAAKASDGPGGVAAPSADERPGSTGGPVLPAQTRQAGERDARISAARLRRIQRRLGVRADGVVGRRTRAAIRRFQVDARLPVTGRLTAETVRRLERLDRLDRAQVAPAGATAAQVLAAARAAIGAAYRSGATGPASYDCSGLTVEVFAGAGIRLPRTSFDQYRRGQAVGKDEIQPGDLVFFNTDGPGASHVGIATSARKVISATSSRGVVEHRLDDAYWGAHYLGARRLSA